MAARTIGMVAMNGVQLLDVSGPADVFAEANVQAGEPVYSIRVLGSAPGTIEASSGMRIVADEVLGSPASLGLDTLLVAGAPHLHRRARDPELYARLRAMAEAARRYGSVCTGAFLLAETGLLDGRRATTHWALAERFAERFPAVQLEMDAIHVRDGRLRTSAGVTAGLDLALSLVEEDLGKEIARSVAAQLVMYFRRPGGQLHYSRNRQGSPVGRSILQEVQRWVIAHPDAPHDVASLAARAGISPRHFARLFHEEVGATPSFWVEGVRIEAARQLLEDGVPPKLAAARCGFAEGETFRRAFQRRLGVTPAAYRAQHRRAGQG
ncbi:transcriptional regulator GlxA family with amidase domain [Sphingomonas kyeonggiensis]|uniref:GlxA family transcriptional regulator n=1 Tax=Sphingomonas kyeonggiensis TaxID=1268553 RepID=UPI0027836AEE|nr:GlxA family transcriptional regulator [Sphingomonas kyeonggiensis]MDQ0250086.1 transcriptional regulator GlxA family with amidase domain [Sphingomonas kyeonggiensis]